jgi:ubiquinone/menaquinone biosynthesis C-methylase UbiE
MNADQASLWTDRSVLQRVQYRTDANLAARQSLYQHQQPRIDLPAAVLDLASPRGDEMVADVGCGNGAYLAELARRGHAGPVTGVDLSVGMLAAAHRRAPTAGLLAGDAAALPLRDHAADLTLSAHMLYHVPDARAAVRELRRITRPGGAVLVLLNDHDHLRELRDLMAAAFRSLAGQPPQQAWPRLDEGQDLLASEFTSVVRHDFVSELLIPGPEPIQNYARSTVTAQNHPDLDAVAAAVVSCLSAVDWPLPVRSHSGCLICT